MYKGLWVVGEVQWHGGGRSQHSTRRWLHRRGGSQAGDTAPARAPVAPPMVRALTGRRGLVRTLTFASPFP